MDYKIPKFIQDVSDKLESAGYEAYVVGGAVRDLIMGRIIEDWDFTTNATPEEVLKIFDNSFYNNAYGTVMYPVEQLGTPIDITTYRTEHGYSDARRPDSVQWGKSIEEDIKRRDFTINAIAIKLPRSRKVSEKDFVDPHNGLKDLDAKLIRTVGDANNRFAEDALRMMRAVRIASQLGFEIEENTTIAIQKNSGLINKIAGERIRDEFFKILLAPKPDRGVLMLKNVSLMKEVLPELYDCFGVDQLSPMRHHKDDVGTHLLKSLKECRSEQVITRFATLIHDIGKPATRSVTNQGVVTFYNHEMVGAKIANKIADKFRLSNQQKDILWRLVRYHQFSVTEKQSDTAIRRFIRNVGKDLIPEMLELRRSDRIGSGATETSWRTEEFKKRLIEVQKQPFMVTDLKITGYDIMKEMDIKPGPEVGKILNQLFDLVVQEKVKNTKKSLMAALKEITSN